MNKYHTLTIDGEEYKLRLTVSSILAIEKKLGKTLYSALEDIQYNMVETMSFILWGALQKFNPNFSYEKATDLFDQYIDEGHSIEELMEELNAMFDASGFFAKGQVQ